MYKPLTGKLGKTATNEASETSETGRTHTYGSLLHRLRKYLIENGLLSEMAEDGSGVEVGQFIEFTGVVRDNPFTSSFHTLNRMLKFVELAMSMQSGPQQATARSGGSRANRPPGQGSPKQTGELSQLKALEVFFEQLAKDVEREGTSTIVFEGQSSEYRAIVTVFEEFLRDRSMAELLNREFRVLGKVARHLPTGSTEVVDLLASSGVAAFPTAIVERLSSGLSEMSGAGVAQVSTPTTTIDPPVVEIIPIAIYL